MAVVQQQITNTPWGTTGVWMDPPRLHPVYDTVNPWKSEIVWTPLSTPNERNPPPAHLSKRWTLPIKVRPDQMKFVIGNKGSVFKSITEKTQGGLYIWFDKTLGKQGEIEIWGVDRHSLLEMKHKLTRHMALIRKNNP